MSLLVSTMSALHAQTYHGNLLCRMTTRTDHQLEAAPELRTRLWASFFSATNHLCSFALYLRLVGLTTMLETASSMCFFRNRNPLIAKVILSFHVLYLLSVRVNGFDLLHLDL